MIPLIDCDYLVYQVGFALESSSPAWVHFWWNGEERHAYLSDGWRVARFLELQNLRREEVVVQPALPIHIVLGRVKQVLQGHLWDIKYHIETLDEVGCEVEGPEIYLSGPENFRDEIAVTVPYKGNRADAPKPFWYNEIREYLVNSWGAVVTDGYEADDALSIRARVLGSTECMMCSIDKDLWTVPGWHYHLGNREVSWVSEQEAQVFLARQIVMGDASDNIKGIPKVGPVKAAQIVTDDEVWPLSEAYSAWLLYAGEHEGAARFLENAALLQLLKTDPNKGTKGSLENLLAARRQRREYY